MAALVQTRLHELDPEIPVWNVRPLQQMISASVNRERAAFLFVALFSTLALALAAVGTYGVIAYTVSERRREIGIRSALGARPGQLAGAVLRDASITAAIGLAAGATLALFATRALQGLLFGVHRFDPLSFGATIILLQAVTLGAAWLPARRAARVPPFEALRTE
jgi:ABC-type antimicrobial peptide transport system permease subunit